MKRAGWPADDSPRRKGTRRVRLYIVVNSKGSVLSVHVTRKAASYALLGSYPWGRIRRATALVRFVDPAPKEAR